MAFTTWNPSDFSGVTLSNGNLTATTTGANGGVRGVDSNSAGKFYFEATLTTGGSTWDFGFGIASGACAFGYNGGGGNAGPSVTVDRGNGYAFINGSGNPCIGAVTTGAIVCCAVDLTNLLIWFRQGAAGNWNGSATNNPATGVGGVSFASLGRKNWYPFAGFAGVSGGPNVAANFGASAFAGVVPSGFTSGWTTGGATLVTSAQATQVAIEEWIKSANPSAQITQVAIEEWAAPRSNAQVTQVAVEQWASVAVLTFAAGAGEADAAAIVTGAGATVAAPPGVGAGEVDAAATVTGVGTTILVAAGAGEVDASADVEGAGFVGAIGVGEVDAAAIVTGMGALVTPPGALPFVPGIGWSVHRRPTFDTIVATHPSGAEVRLALWQNCLWKFELSYDALASNDAYPGVWTNTLQTLLGFYLARGGQHGTFLFVDPDFNQMVGQGIGAGDGTTIVFPFYRVFGGQAEPVSWVTAVAAIYLDGVAQPSGWTVNGNTVTFAAPPASGVVISADFSYGFMCRFLEDTLDFEEFMDNLWQLKSLKFRQVRQ